MTFPTSRSRGHGRSALSEQLSTTARSSGSSAGASRSVLPDPLNILHINTRQVEVGSAPESQSCSFVRRRWQAGSGR